MKSVYWYLLKLSDFGAVRWKLRQKYSEIRAQLGGGAFVWTIETGIRFVSHQGNQFSHIIFVCKGHEKVEMDWCRRWLQPGETVIDCGANIGYFSAYLSQACPLHKILAIEGNPRTVKVLRQTLSLLHLSNIEVIEAVLTESETDLFLIPDQVSMEPWQRACLSPEPVLPIANRTLDEIVETSQIRPDLIKIDCEGFEVAILRGARKILASQRPTLMIECNDQALAAAGTNRKDLFALLQSFDYRLYYLASFSEPVPLGLEISEKVFSAEFNFAAVPQEEQSMERWNQSLF